MSSGFDSGGKGNGGGKAKKGGFVDGLRAFGADFADAFARNISAGGAGAQRSTKPRDPVAVRDRPIAMRQVQNRLNVERKAADDEAAGKQDAPAPDAEEQLEPQSAAGGVDAAAHGNSGGAPTASDDASADPGEPGPAAQDAEKKGGDDGKGEAPEEAKPSLSVAAKLKGVHRKVFLAAKAPTAPAAGAAGANQPVTETGTMEGVPQTLRVDPVADTITLNGADAIAAGQAAVAALPPTEDPRTAEAKAMVDGINAKLRVLRDRIVGSSSPTTEELKALSRETMAAMQAFGDKFDVKRLGDPLPAFPAPVVGPHPVSGPPGPDGVPRHSHHVPPKELAQAMGRSAKEAVSALEDMEDAAELQPTIQKLSAMVDKVESNKGGNGLTAILVHEVTHLADGGTGVHSATMKPQIFSAMEKECKESGRQRLVVMNKVNKGLPQSLAVNPNSTHFTPFMQKAQAAAATISDAKLKARKAQEIQEATAQGQQISAAAQQRESEKAVTVLREQLKIAFSDSFNQAKAAIGAALNASHVDGTPAERSAALGQIEAQAPPAWNSVVNPG